MLAPPPNDVDPPDDPAAAMLGLTTLDVTGSAVNDGAAAISYVMQLTGVGVTF